MRSLLLHTALVPGLVTMAQVSGPVKFLPITDVALDKGRVPIHYEVFSPMCNKDGLVFYCDHVDVLRTMDMSTGKVIASKAITLEKEKGFFKEVRAFFLIGEHPAILYSSWERKTGRVALYAQRYDPHTLEASAPIEVGAISFDPKWYGGAAPKVRVIPSPDNTRLLFYFDRIHLQKVQVAMCWVTDNDLRPVWSGNYRVPAQAAGFSAAVVFDDDASVYLTVDAVLLTDETTKEKSDGSITARVRSLKNKEASVFKLHDKEFLYWDTSLPGGYEIHDLKLALHQGDLHYGGVASMGDAKAPTMWVTGRLGRDLRPEAPAAAPFQARSAPPQELTHLAMGDDGEAFMTGYADGYTTVCAMDRNGALAWETTLKWAELKDRPMGRHLLVLNGMPRMFAYNLGPQGGAKQANEVVQRSLGETTPIMITFKPDGKAIIEELATKEHNASKQVGFPTLPYYEGVLRCGHFVDATYSGKPKGIYMVPVQ